MAKKKEPEIIDLVPVGNGEYGVKEEKRLQAPKTKSKKKSNVDEFFEGMDIGLDFVEGISKRVDRILKLRS